MSEKDRIKQVRKDKGLTLVKFGERLGVSNAALSMVENGKNAVSDQLRRSICREFSVNENWLRTGEGSMYIETNSIEDKIDALLSSESELARDTFKRFCSLGVEEWEALGKVINGLLNQQEKNIISSREELHNELDRQIDTVNHSPGKSEAS